MLKNQINENECMGLYEKHKLDLFWVCLGLYI